MGRWTQYDEDDYRLPEGMKRVGYDADTQRYTYKDQQGTTWVGPEGSQYGELKKVSSEPTDAHFSHSTSTVDDESDHEELIADASNEDDLEASVPSRGDGYQPMATEDCTTKVEGEHEPVPSSPAILPDNSGLPVAGDPPSLPVESGGENSTDVPRRQSPLWGKVRRLVLGNLTRVWHVRGKSAEGES